MGLNLHRKLGPILAPRNQIRFRTHQWHTKLAQALLSVRDVPDPTALQNHLLHVLANDPSDEYPNRTITCLLANRITPESSTSIIVSGAASSAR